MGHFRPLFLYFRLFNTVNVQCNCLPLTGLEPRTSDVGNDHSTNWATTTALCNKLFLPRHKITNLGVANQPTELGIIKNYFVFTYNESGKECKGWEVYRAHRRVHKVITSIGSKQELIENSFDICTTKLKLDIYAFLYTWPVNLIDVVTLLKRGRPQAGGRPCFFYLVYRNLWPSLPSTQSVKFRSKRGPYLSHVPPSGVISQICAAHIWSLFEAPDVRENIVSHLFEIRTTAQAVWPDG